MVADVRVACCSDAPLLPQIERDAAQLFRVAEGLEWLADESGTTAEAYLELIHAGTVWIAGKAAVPHGFLAAREEQDELHIVELSVGREWQRRGLGRLLLATAVNHARRRGLAGLTLTTFDDLPWNAPFYTGLGFRRLEEVELSPRLRALLEAEGSAGLPMHRRNAMRMSL